MFFFLFFKILKTKVHIDFSINSNIEKFKIAHMHCYGYNFCNNISDFNSILQRRNNIFDFNSKFIENETSDFICSFSFHNYYFDR